MLEFFIGMTGFEPAASSSRTTRSTKLSHIPNIYFVNKTPIPHESKTEALVRDQGLEPWTP